MKKNKLKYLLLFLTLLPLVSYANMVKANASSTTTSNTANSATMPSNVVPQVDSDKVVLNFENADIQSVIKAISQLSGKNFVIDPRVKGTVNIVSDRPISKVDSYKVLESALRMQGFASVEADGVIKVLPEADARTYGMKTETGFHASVSTKHQLGDQVITKIFVIQHGSATALSNSLRPLIAPNNSISVYPNSNALIITDYSSNIKRIAQIIAQLTSVNDGIAVRPEIVTLHTAVAADVAEMLQSYINGGGTSGGGRGGNGGGANTEVPNVTITVDPDTNSLILYSPIKDTLQELISLAEQIDKNISSVNSNMHVVYLKNGDANHIAEILRDVIKDQENPDITASSAQAKFTTEPTSTFNSGGSSGGGSGGGGGAAATMSSSAQTRSSSSRSGGNGNTKPGQPEVVIQADPTTNALIIVAPQAVYKNIRMIIDMLDVRRAQVMIEAMVADINQSVQGTFGIQWLVGGGGNNGGVMALGNYAQNGNSISNLATTALTATGASNGSAGAAAAGAAGGISIPNEVYVGLVTGTTTVGGTTIPTMSALADMLTANNASNILSRPTLITMDNEEARIMVGENVPIPNGSFTATGGLAGNLTTTITRQDLGIILEIKPLITQNGAIQLDVYQEDSSVDATTQTSPNGPSFLERKLRTTLLVDDGQIIALGGMTNDQVTITQDGIPGLSEIPYLGWLFSWQQRTHTKTNLVLFLRPVIIKNADGYKALTNQRYNYIMDQENQIKAKQNAVLPEIKPVTLDNQLPYDNQVTPQSNPSLNLNTNLPVVDLTNNGANLKKSNAAGAINSSSTMITPLAPPTNKNIVIPNSN